MMGVCRLWSVCLLLSAIFKLNSPPPALAGYTASVVEHAAISWLLPYINREQAMAIINLNLDIYDYYIVVAVSKGADIIVFPEYGVTGFIREEREYILPFLEAVPTPNGTVPYIPCHERSRDNIPIQYRLSCLALKHNITVVANLMTLKYCHVKTDPNCPSDGRYQFNTDVAFARDGQLVARYHKENLYTGEAEVFNPGQNQTSVAAFRTEFGYFGLFTCFDLLFKEPAKSLVSKLGVDTMVFPTAWMNELPLLSAVEYQQAWSLSYGVNLLASNQHYPIAQMTGSGIYSPESGAITHIYDMQSLLGKMVVGRIQSGKASSRALETVHGSNHLVYRDEGRNDAMGASLLHVQESSVDVETHHAPRKSCSRSVPQFFISLLNHDPYNLTLLEGTKGHITISNNNVSCTLDFSRSSDSELYALGAFDGLHTNNGNYYVQCCALVRCGSDSDPYRCGAEVGEATTVFQSFDLRIEGQSPLTRLFPEVISSRIGLPEVGKAWVFSTKKDRIWSSGDGVTEPLVAVTVFGRWYQQD